MLHGSQHAESRAANEHTPHGHGIAQTHVLNGLEKDKQRGDVGIEKDIQNENFGVEKDKLRENVGVDKNKLKENKVLNTGLKPIFGASKLQQYCLLVFICMVSIGDYVCLDMTAALQERILTDMGISQRQYISFYSTSQLGAILTSLCGGFLVDFVGNRITLFTCAVLVVITQTTFSFGAYLGSYGTMWTAKALHGLLEGPINIANDNMAVKWFQHGRINLVMGLKTSIARGSSVASMNAISHVYDHVDTVLDGKNALAVTLMTGTCVAIVSAVAAAMVMIIDKRADQINKNKSFSDAPKKKPEIIHISYVKGLPAAFWLISVLTCLYYMQLTPFVAQGQAFFRRTYNRSTHEANTINSMIYLVAAVTMPVWGLAVDMVGRNMMYLMFGILLSITSHLLMAFTFVDPYVCAILLGLGYSMVATTVWPLVSFVVPFYRLGSSFGIMTTTMTAGQALNSYLVGYIVDTHGYFFLELYFVVCATCSLILSTLLLYKDASQGGQLNLSPSQRMAKKFK